MLTKRKAVPMLRMLKGETPGRIFEINSDPTLIGRMPDCDIWLSDGKISKRHARIFRGEDAFYLEDLNSHNHTYLAGKLLPPNKPVALKDGDGIEICDIHFVFHTEIVTIEELDEADLKEDDTGSTILGMLALEDSSQHNSPIVSSEDIHHALVEISRNLCGSIRLDEVLEKALDSLFTIFPQADRGFVLFKDPTNTDLVPKAIKYRGNLPPDLQCISRTVFNHVLEEGKAILSADLGVDKRFKNAESVLYSHVRTMMCVPLRDASHRTVGIIQIDTRDQRANFKERDLALMIAIAGQVELAVENNRLHLLERKRQSLEMEMQGARRVQLALLPHETPALEGYCFWQYYEPAQLVGGDYYDYIPLSCPGANPERWAVALGDVAGKGMPAALMMTKLSAEARMSILMEADPAQVLCRLNERLCAANIPDRFVTFLLVLIDGQAHRLTVVNAGHMGPMIRRSSGHVEVIGEDQSGLMLGVNEDSTYAAVEIDLEPGDMVVLYTDGVSEALNPRDVMFTNKRVAQVLAATQAREVEPLGRALIHAVQSHANNRPQSDDIALICFGRERATFNDTQTIDR